jgi:hypothetical protein
MRDRRCDGSDVAASKPSRNRPIAIVCLYISTRCCYPFALDTVASMRFGSAPRCDDLAHRLLHTEAATLGHRSGRPTNIPPTRRGPHSGSRSPRTKDTHREYATSFQCGMRRPRQNRVISFYASAFARAANHAHRYATHSVEPVTHSLCLAPTSARVRVIRGAGRTNVERERPVHDLPDARAFVMIVGRLSSCPHRSSKRDTLQCSPPGRQPCENRGPAVHNVTLQGGCCCPVAHEWRIVCSFFAPWTPQNRPPRRTPTIGKPETSR